MSRMFLKKVKRVVVKVGSGLIANEKFLPSNARLRRLVEQISCAQKNGYEVVLVSSGAIVLGMGEMGVLRRPSELDQLQAFASIGQALLMKKYNDLFRKSKSKCSQILLTWDDFHNHERYKNVRQTIKTMLSWGVVPIINENDSVTNDEIKFGDNDKLSALVASCVEADLLLILSDVDGLYDMRTPDKKLFREVKEITKEIESVAGGSVNKNVSKGGMKSKIDAIKIAVQSKIACVIAHGQTENVLNRVLAGENIGTYFSEKEEKLLSHKHWIAFGAKPQGFIVVDDGARKAVLDQGKSLLLPGIVSWSGHFKKGDVVVVQDKQGQEIGRGNINYSIIDLHDLTDKKGQREAIHRDDLVLTGK
ncbi:MAG: glutamate 5-kinase [Candidatus Omnitrophica bacterium]|nr:glutamate 5-kinase [Candidatus Omnitrophota bacterium]